MNVDTKRMNKANNGKKTTSTKITNSIIDGTNSANKNNKKTYSSFVKPVALNESIEDTQMIINTIFGELEDDLQQDEDDLEGLAFGNHDDDDDDEDLEDARSSVTTNNDDLDIKKIIEGAAWGTSGTTAGAGAASYSPMNHHIISRIPTMTSNSKLDTAMTPEYSAFNISSLMNSFYSSSNALSPPPGLGYSTISEFTSRVIFNLFNIHGLFGCVYR